MIMCVDKIWEDNMGRKQGMITWDDKNGMTTWDYKIE
jgi:hypothetical protein